MIKGDLHTRARDHLLVTSGDTPPGIPRRLAGSTIWHGLVSLGFVRGGSASEDFRLRSPVFLNYKGWYLVGLF